MPSKVSKRTKIVFKVSGNYKKGKKSHKFTKEVLGENKQGAQEYIYSIIGSKHRVKRREIQIEKVEEITINQVTDPIIKELVGGK